jgi:malate synthase
MPRALEFRADLLFAYEDVGSPQAIRALEALAPLDRERRDVMAVRLERRRQCAAAREPLTFLDAGARIPRTSIAVADARAGRFRGTDIPAELQRQGIRGTGRRCEPARGPLTRSARGGQAPDCSPDFDRLDP